MQRKFHILEPVGPPKREFPVPFPEEGTVYDYKFIKEVGVTQSMVYLHMHVHILDLRRISENGPMLLLHQKII